MSSTSFLTIFLVKRLCVYVCTETVSLHYYSHLMHFLCSPLIAHMSSDKLPCRERRGVLISSAALYEPALVKAKNENLLFLKLSKYYHIAIFVHSGTVINFAIQSSIVTTKLVSNFFLYSVQ